MGWMDSVNRDKCTTDPTKSGNKMKWEKKSKMSPCIYEYVHSYILPNYIFLLFFLFIIFPQVYLGLVYEYIRLQ